jgi:magnesium-transporting ATPase (P-type)
MSDAEAITTPISVDMRGGKSQSQDHLRQIAAQARLSSAALLCQLDTSSDGLTDSEATARLVRVGSNQIAREQQQSIAAEITERARNPLNVLLFALAALSWATGDARAAIVICLMVVLLTCGPRNLSDRVIHLLCAFAQTSVRTPRYASRDFQHEDL